MRYTAPAELFDAVVVSKNRGDVEAYLDCYGPMPPSFFNPDRLQADTKLRGFLSFFSSLKPSFRVTRREFIEGPETRLHLSEWTLTGVDSDANPIDWSGRTSDVLGKQEDGNWLVALDNPWGAALLDIAS